MIDVIANIEALLDHLLPDRIDELIAPDDSPQSSRRSFDGLRQICRQAKKGISARFRDLLRDEFPSLVLCVPNPLQALGTE